MLIPMLRLRAEADALADVLGERERRLQLRVELRNVLPVSIALLCSGVELRLCVQLLPRSSASSCALCSLVRRASASASPCAPDCCAAAASARASTSCC